MNAKFEKWREDNRHSERLCDREIFEAVTKAAIQSLEVTPELVLIGEHAHIQCHGNFDERMNAALTAVLSALKEQAK